MGGMPCVLAARSYYRPAAIPVEKPRTRHLNPDGTPIYANRLSHEASPYLRQHAHNPGAAAESAVRCDMS